MPLPRPADAPTPSLFSLSGKTCLITGGARGIGLAVTTAFAEAGAAAIGMTYSTSTSAPQLAEELSQKHNTTIKAFKMDVRSPSSVAACFAEVAEAFSGVDVVVANAGISTHVDALDMSGEQYRDVMGTNLDGAWSTAQEAGRIFKRQAEEAAAGAEHGGGENPSDREPRRRGPGNLIFTASVSAQLVNVPQRQAAYNASKAAVVHLARCLAVEWAGWGGRVNAVSPGFIETDMIGALPDEWKSKWHDMVPGQRFCAPYELKGVYVFLASDASSYVTGANLTVDGGYTLP